MHLKQLRLTNFQKHSNLTLDFTSGVNYIYGESDAGKSCIRRAIGFLFFGDPRNDDIRKEGTKQTSVLGVLDNGAEIERIKSASINRYIVRKDGKELVYDSIGATIPEDVKKILQVDTIELDKEILNLNIAEQIALPFLYDKSGSFRLKLFNKLTGSDLVDRVIQNLNKEILSIGRDIKTAQEFVEINEPKLNDITQQHEKFANQLGNFREKKEALLVKVEKYKCLTDLQNKLQTINISFTQTEDSLKLIKTISDELINTLKAQINTWVNLDDLFSAVEANKTSLIEAESALKGIKIPEMDIQTVRGQIDRLKALQSLYKQNLDLFKTRTDTEHLLTEINNKVFLLDGQYKVTLQEAKICPVCKQDTSKCEVHL